MEPKRYDRKAIVANLKDYGFGYDDSDFIELTEWYNGEGIDIQINLVSFSLSWTEFEALVYLANKIK